MIPVYIFPSYSCKNHKRQGLQSGIFFLFLSPQILYIFLWSRIHATHLAYVSLFDLITLAMLGEDSSNKTAGIIFLWRFSCRYLDSGLYALAD